MSELGFLPPPSCTGNHDLLTRHMEAHYDRVSTAKGTIGLHFEYEQLYLYTNSVLLFFTVLLGRTDTGPPVSLLKCTKGECVI